MANAEWYDIAVDPGRHLLRTTLRGRWSLDAVQAYRQAVLAEAERMTAAGCARDAILMLVDARQVLAQPRDVVSAYKSWRGAEGFAPKRMATLVALDALPYPAAKRRFEQARLFLAESIAMAWLLQGNTV